MTLETDGLPILAMAAAGGNLYATISVFDATALVCRLAVTSKQAWESIGTNNVAEIVAMAAGLDQPDGDESLYALSSTNRLWSRGLTLTTSEEWKMLALTEDVIGLGVSWFGSTSTFYAVTSTNLLVGRNAAKADGPWHVLGHADNVAAMTGTVLSAHSGAVFVATKDGELLRLDTTAVS